MASNELLYVGACHLPKRKEWCSEEMVSVVFCTERIKKCKMSCKAFWSYLFASNYFLPKNVTSINHVVFAAVSVVTSLLTAFVWYLISVVVRASVFFRRFVLSLAIVSNNCQANEKGGNSCSVPAVDDFLLRWKYFHRCQHGSSLKMNDVITLFSSVLVFRYGLDLAWLSWCVSRLPWICRGSFEHGLDWISVFLAMAYSRRRQPSTPCWALCIRCPPSRV